MQKKNDQVYMGKCVKPHGIKGALHFQLINPQESTLADGSAIWLYPMAGDSSLPEAGQRFVLDKITFGHKVMAYFEGVNGRNEAEALLPFEIFQEREEFPELEPGEYYLEDLKGFDVIDQKNEQVFGRIQSFYGNGAQEVMVVRPQEGAMVEIPFVEAFIHEVDLEKKKVYVTRPQLID